MKLHMAIIFAAVTLSSAAPADVRPARCFTENMVVQRESEVPVWGWAEGGEKVTVSASWGSEASTTAGENGEWMVRLRTPQAGGPFQIEFTGRNRITCSNVLSGEVWLCSGQSNMAMQVRRCNDAEQEIRQADFPQIRYFDVGKNATRVPAADCTGAWQICSPGTVGTFSGTAFFTGRALHENLQIPIGLIQASWGGTSIEAWTALAAQEDDPFVREVIKAYDDFAAQYDGRKAEQLHRLALKKWEEAVQKARSENKKIPSRPRPIPHPHQNKNYPGNLYHGMINPLVPYGLKGIIWYQGERNANRFNAAAHYRVQLARLINSWREAWDRPLPFYFVQLPNHRKPQREPAETANTWPVIRDGYVHVLRHVPNTGMVVTIDIGDENDIHPTNKQDVGTRLASTILNETYGKNTPTCPVYHGQEIDEDRITVTFEYTGSGLEARNGSLKGFAIAAADRIFHWAEAEIHGDSVTVHSDQVKEPVAVRYAWADNPAGCNLYSREGFPASPFRTDDWDLVAPSRR